MSDQEPQVEPQAEPAVDEPQVDEQKSYLQKILEPGMSGDQATQAKKDIEALVREVTKGVKFGSKRVDKSLKERIEEIDRLLSLQVAEIMHTKDFQKLEGTWRGLHYLVHKSNTGKALKIRVLNVSKDDLKQDILEDASGDPLESELFQHVYEQEYGIFGGKPYGLLIGDYEWGKSKEEVDTLAGISGVAAAAFAPFVSAASPDLFRMKSFTQLGAKQDLEMIYESVEFADWNAFRRTPDSRFVALTMPRVLMRQPYGEGGKSSKKFVFEEGVDGKNHEHYSWGNAAYAFGVRCTEAYDKYGWCVAVVGVEGGGLVEGLPTHTFKTDDGDIALKCPSEIGITDRSEAQLYKLGFMPLVHRKDDNVAAFFGAQSTRQVEKFEGKDADAANANEELSAQLQYQMAVARFSHYLKSMMRDKISGFYEREDVEKLLNNWISGYVLLEGGGQEAKAKYPLKSARIDVVEKPGQPGCYQAIAYLRPHFQLKEIDFSMRLVADLPEPKG